MPCCRGGLFGVTERVGLLAPMELEIRPLRRELRAIETTKKAGVEMTRGLLRGRPVVLAVSGVGKVRSAIAAQAMIDQCQLDVLILTGVAGALSPELAPGDVVVATRFHQYDVGMVRRDRYTPSPSAVGSGERGGPLSTAQRASAHLARLALGRGRLVSYPWQTRRAPQVVEGAIITGDSLLLWPEGLAWLARTFDAVAIDMETAAVAQVAEVNGVEFAAIRAISDVAADMARLDLESMSGVAAAGSLGGRLTGAVRMASSMLGRPRNTVELLRLARAMRGAAANAAALVSELVAAMD